MTQLQPLQQQVQPSQRPSLKKLQQRRRGSKRKLEDEGSSDDDEDDADEAAGPGGAKQPLLLAGVGRGAGVLSPASSSCHSTGLATAADSSPRPSVPTPATPVTAAASANSNHHPAEDGDSTAPTSVKDLEHAMSKHLPAVPLGKCE